MSTFDIAIYQPPATPDQPYVAGLATETISGRAITGSEKLAQRFILELLTMQGSQPFATSRGCSFLSNAIGGNAISEFDLITTFNLALTQIQTNIQSEEAATDPDNERFENAVITRLEVDQTRIMMSCTLYSRAGVANFLKIPLSLVPVPSESGMPLD